MAKRKKAKPIKRPYSTHYYQSAGDKFASFSSQGAASSEEGAIRATVVRVFLNQYAKAVIHDRRSGVAIYTVKLTADGLKVHYGREEASYESTQLRRVK